MKISYSKFSENKLNVRAIILKDNKVLMVNQYTSNSIKKPVWTLPGGKYTSYFRCNYLFKRKVIDKVYQKTGVKVKAYDAIYINRNHSLIVFKCVAINDSINIDRSNPKNKDVISVEYLDINDCRLTDFKKVIDACLRKI